MEEFLAQINITVSRQTIHDFLKRRAKTPKTNDLKNEINEPQIETTADSPEIFTSNKNVEKTEQSENKNHLLESLNEQREASEAKKFRHDPTGRKQRENKGNE
jgi:hypothetical protein